MSIFHSLNLGDALFNWQPDAVQTYIDSVWENGSQAWPASVTSLATKPPPNNATISLSWEHLIYAYLVENSLAYEIFGKVIREYVSGETLGPPDPQTANWLRLTEALFYRHPAATLSYAVESELRPDHRAVRRNAYYRMFGIDLNHGGADQQPYPYTRPASSNRDFVSVLEELLRELWVAIANLRNTSGANPTDDARIGEKALQLQDMLLLRRQGLMLIREEFFSVVTMGWFEYSLDFASTIVTSLNADAPSPATRLAKIAHRVQMPIPRFAHEYLRMAGPLSRLIQLIESAPPWTTGGAQALYQAPIQADVLTVIDNWSRSTGRDLKSMRVLAIH